MSFTPQTASVLSNSLTPNYGARIGAPYSQIPTSYAFTGKLQAPDMSLVPMTPQCSPASFPNLRDDVTAFPIDQCDIQATKYGQINPFLQVKQFVTDFRRGKVPEVMLGRLTPDCMPQGHVLRGTADRVQPPYQRKQHIVKGRYLPECDQLKIIDVEHPAQRLQAWPLVIGDPQRVNVAANVEDHQIYGWW